MTVLFPGMTLTLHSAQEPDSLFGYHAVMTDELQFTKSATLPAEAGCET